MQTIKPGCYFSHYTAVKFHGLTEQLPKTTYLTGQRQLFLSTGDNYFFPVDWVNSFICLAL
jgi:predicted transcriptional regulator of viral defense system